MKTYGVRISDTKNHIVTVRLPDILQEINNGDQFYWSILFLDIRGDLKEAKPDFADSVSAMEKGFFFGWDELNNLANKCHQIIDITIIGCKDLNFIQQYEDDEETYNKCDIVIEMIDSSYWEVFSKDVNLINRLATKFKKIKYLESNHLSIYLNRKSEEIKIEDARNKIDETWEPK